MDVFSLRKIVLFGFFVLISLPVYSQIDYSNYRSEIKKISQDKTNRDTKKIIRQFNRFLQSNKIDDNEKKKTFNVLNNFQQRKFGFNDFYVPFFQLMLMQVQILISG